MNIHLLGATGSIGLQTLDVVREDNSRFTIVSMSCYKSIDQMMTLIEEFSPSYVAVHQEEDAMMLKRMYPAVEVGYGEEGLVKAATYSENALVVNAIVGGAGLVPTVAAIKHRLNVALANKESLVIGGEIIKPLLKEYGVRLFPLDSEHSAIFQCLAGEEHDQIKNIIITASGGSFRDLSRNDLEHVTLKEALAHPNWSMGSKITIDSATMMNKGFEIIEAHYLFDVAYEKITPLLHRESIVHSMVEFTDTAVIAHLGLPDMRIPIAYALYYPSRPPFKGESLDLAKIGSLHFSEVDMARYPLLDMAVRAGKEKGLMPVTLNAANEAAVQLFLEEKISFLEIEDIIQAAMDYFPQEKDITLDKILNRDKIVKEYVFKKYN